MYERPSLKWVRNLMGKNGYWHQGSEEDVFKTLPLN